VVSRDWEAGTRLVAVVSHPPSGRQLEVFSNQPGLQFYTGIRLLTISNSSTPNNLTSSSDQGLKCLNFEVLLKYIYSI
jgi:galactose mutarotase-like enzyme